MKVEVSNSEKDFLEINFEGDAHTILNLIKRRLLDNKDVSFVGYNKAHPLIKNSTLVVRSKKGKPKDLLKKGIDLLTSDLKSLNIK